METCKKKNVMFIYLGVLMFLSFRVSDVFSSASDTISTNQPLIGLQTIVSKGDIFELGLFNPAPGDSSRYFYIGMWYNQVTPRIIVWVANRESPVRNINFISLKISDGNLILYDHTTGLTFWSTGLDSSSSRKDIQAVLLDNGNLVLKNGSTSTATVLWQSFDHPSDTWLPDAKLRFNNTKMGSQRLTSWKSLTDPSPGRYFLEVDPTANHSLISVWNGSRSYWSSGPWDYGLGVFKETPSMNELLSFKLNLNESYITYSRDTPGLRPSASLYRLVMDASGLFQLYMWKLEAQIWYPMLSLPEDRCEVYNYCGSFGICKETQGLELQLQLQPCSCVHGFVIKESDDFSSGCKRETKLQCGKAKDKFLAITNIELATDPTTLVLPANTTCASACLANCSCQAYANDSNKCLMWTRDVFNLQQLEANKNDGQTFYLRLVDSSISNTKHSKGRRNVLLVRDCTPLLDKIRSRIQSWSSRMLSFAGRLELISSVLTGITQFWCSAFHLPRSCLLEVDRLCAAFLWSGSTLSSSKAKVAWADVCMPRQEGGLGLRSLRDVNTVFSLRLVWRLLSSAPSLWVNWIKRFIIRSGSFWTSRLNSGSWMWRKLLKLRPLAIQFTRWDIGPGSSISFWYDHWSDLGPLHLLTGEGGPIALGIPLRASIQTALAHPRLSMTQSSQRSPTLRLIVDALISLLASARPSIDILLWRQSHLRFTNLFNAKHTWASIRLPGTTVSWHPAIWFFGAIPKHAFISWLAVRDRLATAIRTSAWSTGVSSLCTFGCHCDETRDHLFFDCSYSMQVWSPLATTLLGSLFSTRWNDLLPRISSTARPTTDVILLSRITFQASIYFIWQERNSRVHGGPSIPHIQLTKNISTLIRQKIISFGQDRKDSLLRLWSSTRFSSSRGPMS